MCTIAAASVLGKVSGESEISQRLLPTAAGSPFALLVARSVNSNCLTLYTYRGAESRDGRVVVRGSGARRVRRSEVSCRLGQGRNREFRPLAVCDH